MILRGLNILISNSVNYYLNSFLKNDFGEGCLACGLLNPLAEKTTLKMPNLQLFYLYEKNTTI